MIGLVLGLVAFGMGALLVALSWTALEAAQDMPAPLSWAYYVLAAVCLTSLWALVYVVGSALRDWGK